MPRLHATLFDERCMYLVLDFINGGELFDLAVRARFPEPAAKALMRQLLQGIAYIHSLGLAHRDVSLENAMLHYPPPGGREGELPTVKIIDFGLASPSRAPPAGPHGAARCCSSSRLASATPRAPFAVGKIGYMAPEVFAGKESYDATAADMWAFGVW